MHHDLERAILERIRNLSLVSLYLYVLPRSFRGNDCYLNIKKDDVSQKQLKGKRHSCRYLCGRGRKISDAEKGKGGWKILHT